MFSFLSPDNLPLLVHLNRRYRPVVLTNIAHNSFIFFVSPMLKKRVKRGRGEAKRAIDVEIFMKEKGEGAPLVTQDG